MQATPHRLRAHLWVLAAVAAWLPLGAQERELFSGAALLYTVPEVTVVYPAGAEKDRERNRISAERRAAYLRGRHNTETRVVADVDMTAEDRKDHLLVLGWDNLLVAEAGVIRLTETGWSFEGLERGFEHDLLFSWVSPFDETHEYVFWSRIDPELDRYLVLPFFGSDWIVFDGYTVEQYGRFSRDPLRWPPKRNPEVEIDNRPDRPALPASAFSEHYALFDRSLTLDAAEIARILEAREQAWRATVEALGAAPERPDKIKLFVYRDSDAKEARCDVHDARHHVPDRNELHLTKPIALSPDPHEDIHLIARQLYGPGYLTLFVEGLAVWAEQQRGEDELPVYAGMLVGKQELPGIARLLDEETMRVLIRGRVGFPLAGLFVAWLRAEAGAEAIGKVYGQYASDPARLASAIGVPAGDIDKRFQKFVRAQAELGETELEFRAATARARHYGSLGDYEQAIPALERALELQPGHLLTRYSLAVALVELDDLEGAEAEFRKMLELHGEAPDEEMAALAWFRLGDVYARRDEQERARTAYGMVLELPDRRDLHARARRALDGLNAD